MIDRVVRIRAIPRPGETVAALSSATFAGGKGANQAAAAAKCGARVRMLGRTARDGAFIREALAKAGVHVRDIATDDTVAGTATVMVAESGENAIVIAPESNLRITSEEIERFLSRAKQGEIVLFQNECALLSEGIAMAAARALRVWLNAAPADETLRAIRFEKLAGLIVNETEAEVLTGKADPHRALELLAKRMPGGAVIVTLGAAGAITAIGSARYAHGGFAVDAVDTVGCGDAFVGVFLATISEGRDIAQALAHGNAAGALAAMRAGAMRSLPTREEIEVVAILPEKTRLKPRPPAEDEGALPAQCFGCGYQLLGRVEGDACPECGRIVRRVTFSGRWASVAVRRCFGRAWKWAIGAEVALFFGAIGIAIAMNRPNWLTSVPRDFIGFIGLGCVVVHVVAASMTQVGMARGLQRVAAERWGIALACMRVGAVGVITLIIFRMTPWGFVWGFPWDEVFLGAAFTTICAVDMAFIVLLERTRRLAGSTAGSVAGYEAGFGKGWSARRPVAAIAGLVGAGLAMIASWMLVSQAWFPQAFCIGFAVAGVLLAWLSLVSVARGIAREIRIREERSP